MRISTIHNYGLCTEASEKLINKLEHIFCCQGEPHDSQYKGDYWVFNNSPNNRAELSFNRDPLHDTNDDCPEEYYLDFENKECNLLLHIVGEPEWVSGIHDALLRLVGMRLINSQTHEWNQT